MCGVRYVCMLCDIKLGKENSPFWGFQFSFVLVFVSFKYDTPYSGSRMVLSLIVSDGLMLLNY